MAGGVVSEPYYATLSDAGLKAEANRLVVALEQASQGHEAAVLCEIAVVREEMIDRLRRRGDEGDDHGGVREPRVPRPGSGGARATAFPERPSQLCCSARSVNVQRPGLAAPRTASPKEAVRGRRAITARPVLALATSGDCLPQRRTSVLPPPEGGKPTFAAHHQRPGRRTSVLPPAEG
jgi:hypothetical protein